MANRIRSNRSEYRVRAVRAGVRRPAVRFEPTPQAIVTAMLELAAVTELDVVYDLGSGDGRIAITAAKRFGARAVGIESNPRLVEQSTRRAAACGVGDRVRFLNTDLYEADITAATVVTLFLLPEANWLLRPKLFRELATGARVVSYIHEMADWKPQQARYTVDRVGWYHRIYLWTIPPREAAETPFDAQIARRMLT